ncbi:MAG: hypothetical protein WA991_12590 [Ornithinimicrobium sp.]
MADGNVEQRTDARPRRWPYPGQRPWWTPFWFGCIAGIGPWLAVAGYLIVNVGMEGGEGPPAFVYGIMVSIFIFFNSFALNQWLQYRQIGPWKDYLVSPSATVNSQ